MNTYGKAVVAFSDNGRGFAVLYSYGAVREFLARAGPVRLIQLLCPNPSAPLMVWEGELYLAGRFDHRIDGRWRTLAKAELEDCLAEWTRPDPRAQNELDGLDGDDPGVPPRTSACRAAAARA